MHVALVSPSWPPEQNPNGIVTYVRWMRQELTRQGHRVSVVTGDLRRPDSDAHPVRASMPTRARHWLQAKTGSSNEAVFGVGAAIADTLLAVHRRVPIDVVEMEESFGWFDDVAARTAIPTVVKLHGPAFMSLVEEELNTPLAACKIAREGEALRRARIVTSPASKTLEQTIVRYGLAPAIARHVVNPLVLPASAPVWALEHCEPKTVLFVGRFDKRKGGDLVLQAFARLLDDDPALRLVFVGPDVGVVEASGERTHVEAMASALLPAAARGQFDYRGSLRAEQIYPLRAQALLTVVASRWENQSYTALEAMLQGCPLVSSDAGGQPEFVIDGETGLLASAGEATDMAAKIRRLLDDPAAAARLGAQARDHVLRHHSPAVVVAQTLAVYREAVALASTAQRA